MLNTKDRYVEREPLLKATIRGANADVMSFQEVVYGDESLDELVGGQTSRQERHDLSAMTDLPARRSYLQHLAPSQIQDKSVWKCPDPNFNQNGNAMVTD